MTDDLVWEVEWRLGTVEPVHRRRYYGFGAEERARKYLTPSKTGKG